MKHYGDIKRLHGEQLEPVDIIIGGSPCQNLSIAGNRQGLSGEQSSLFLEQIRVVKESRKYHGEPRFMLWENVPGAITSNSGEDFRRVLEETVRIKEESVSIPRPANGKWSNAGCIMGDGFSVAWRIHDAQFWGVPQCRRRIALVADFDGQCAGEILFERESLSGDSTPCGTPWEDIAADAERGFRADNRARGIVIVSHPKVYDARGNGDGEIVPTLTGDHENRVTDYTAICIGNEQAEQLRVSEKVGALNCMHDQQAIISIDRAAFNQGENACYDINISDNGIAPSQVAKGTSAVCTAVDCRNDTENPDVNGTLQTKSTGGQSLNLNNAVQYRYTPRRLTPLECERLQGYPCGWTDIGEWTDAKGKTHKTSDTARYKALGNSIALPFWHWLLNRFASYLPESPTMGSLFDGIGGFPLCWERIYGKGTAVWASEIEPFCIAVTERRFNNIT